MLLNISKYTWVFLDIHGKAEDIPVIVEPINTAYMDWSKVAIKLMKATE